MKKSSVFTFLDESFSARGNFGKHS
jgi:hypothetical protein